MPVTIGLSVASSVICDPKVPEVPTKLASGVIASNFRSVPAGTLPVVIFALNVRVADVITDEISSLAVESDALGVTD